ncbi:helix-turn-helix domain-containing protein [Haladaptatus sp. DYSN1]|uniref:helix-turn-helix domain-containing protein n=1 Tax=unclassified Haladaptatus TaxID=2622732 RepID=UPI0024058677|nr:helix-turn-helix domain-containing protein [Haladaptatus sp. DYSN1]
MRQFTIRLTPSTPGFHSVDGAIAECRAVTRESFLHLNLLNDGTGVALYRLRGDADALKAVLADSEAVLSFDVFDATREQFHAHVHFEPDDPATALLTLADEHKLIIDTPLEFTGEGGLKLTLAGAQDRIRRAFAGLPESVTVWLERTGEYDPDREALRAALTSRQREVLDVALDLGYYENPRAATHADIAAEFDCAAGTVGEHLRKAEGAVLSELRR